MMAANSIVVQKPPSTYMCSFSLYTSTVVMAMFQTILSALLAVLYKVKIEGDSVIVRILFWIHVCCSVSALLFSLFCLAKRKIGSTYEVVLHGYLLSVLINGLTSLFGVLYIPLFFLQTTHSLMEGLDYFICFSLSGILLFLQWAVKQVTEQMLPVMEHDFKLEPRSNRSTIMNAIYTVVLVASTLAYSAVAWIGLSMDANANEDLF
ncbi:hypothetical protein B9Z55_017023 [Caenorhabditis nigoni]|uniref:Uncharacterized protein n=2 Tax=Caenorhabditis nigoni TaxID=1611254 RepID=A0A2G5T7V9_9PELO|nr:hypothetical protein B9Z55_017023 [Caenorhabditis nigoni]